MENPQIENGHTDIANEVVDQLAKIKLSPSEWQIIMVVLRKTWGWHKKDDWISLSQFEKNTGLHRTTVCKSLKRLVAKRLLVKKNYRYSFNKFYSNWVVAKRLLVAKRLKGSSQTATLLVAKRLPTKETITKETIQKKGNLILKDPDFKKWCDGKLNNPGTLDLRYPIYKYQTEWAEARKVKANYEPKLEK